jgi:hypothetical protein
VKPEPSVPTRDVHVLVTRKDDVPCQHPGGPISAHSKTAAESWDPDIMISVLERKNYATLVTTRVRPRGPNRQRSVVRIQEFQNTLREILTRVLGQAHTYGPWRVSKSMGFPTRLERRGRERKEERRSGS